MLHILVFSPLILLFPLKIQQTNIYTTKVSQKTRIFYHSSIMPSKDQKRKVLMAYSGYGLILFWILISIFICVDDVYCLQSIVVLTLGVFNAFIWTCGLSNWMTLSVRYFSGVHVLLVSLIGIPIVQPISHFFG